MIDIDFIHQNFPKGKLTILGARPAMGKSSLAISLALSLAKAEEKSVYFLLEMSKEHLDRRIILQVGEECYKKTDGKIYIDDTPGNKLCKMQNVINSLPVDYVLVDYIQLINEDYGTSRTEQLSHIVNSLKQFAEDYNVAVVALSQLCRACVRGEKRPPNYWYRPDLSSLYIDKDCLENVNIVLLHRPEYYKDSEFFAKKKIVEGEVEFIRFQGEDETITMLHFDKNTTEFSSMSNM